MADGTTAFSMALAKRGCDLLGELAKGGCDLITEFLQFNRNRDVELARYALKEQNVDERGRQVLEKIIVTSKGQHTKLSLELEELSVYALYVSLGPRIS